MQESYQFLESGSCQYNPFLTSPVLFIDFRDEKVKSRMMVPQFFTQSKKAFFLEISREIGFSYYSKVFVSIGKYL